MKAKKKNNETPHIVSYASLCPGKNLPAYRALLTSRIKGKSIKPISWTKTQASIYTEPLAENAYTD